MLTSFVLFFTSDRNKLVFNICSNKNNAFDRPTLDFYYEVSRAAYESDGCPDVSLSANPTYWTQLYEKFCAIIAEIQDASRSINKSFGTYDEIKVAFEKICTSTGFARGSFPVDGD